MISKRNLFDFILIVSALLMTTGCGRKSHTTISPAHEMELHKLEYNNPGLTVDLDVGFKSIPLPMDFDGDGDFDLLVSETGSYVEDGVFYFENISGNVDMPVFRPHPRISTPRFRIGFEGMLEVSQVNGHAQILGTDPGNSSLLLYKDVPQNVFWARTKVPLPFNLQKMAIHFSRWKMLDFDHDGRVDIICALEGYDREVLLFVKNAGTAQSPVYQKPIKIRLGSWKTSLRLNPLFADFDNDGDFDYIAVGPYARFIYFENIGTPKHYKFAAGRLLKYAGHPIQMECHFGSAIKPTAFDWNRDGFPDILAGDEDGKVSFIKNTGKIVNGVPQFLPPRFFQQEAKYVDFGALAAPRVFDWDGDGKADLIVSSKPAVDWMRNEGTQDGNWILRYMGRVVSRTLMGHTDGPTVADWNHDGIPDLLVGTETGAFYYWLRPRFSLTTTMTTEGIQKPADYPYFKR